MNSRNSKRTFLLLLLSFFSYNIIAQLQEAVQPIKQQPDYIKPSPIWANECVLLTHKGVLICFGGQQESGIPINGMFSLDLYQAWNTTEPAWLEMEHTANLNETTSPVAFFAATYLQNTHMFLIDGGIMSPPPVAAPPSAQETTTVPQQVAAVVTTNKKNQTIYYDTVKSLWVSPTIKGQALVRRKQHTAVSDDQGRVWLWGGLSDISTYGGPNIYYNTWTVINTQSWTISNPTVENNPPPRIDHTATMIANQYILITGGVVYSHDVTDPAGQLTLNPISMSSLLLFDIPNNRWINITAGGNIPAPRRGHSAVLGLDGKSVIIFGGGMPEDDHMTLNDVFILELDTMRWTAPSIQGVPPKPRRYHKAYLVDNFMLVTFGLGGDGKGFDDINILSTSSWAWITQYTPNMAWLSGNGSSVPSIIGNSGIFQNTTGNGTASNDPTTGKNNTTATDASSEIRIKAGVIAGVVSGGVVILGGSIFLVLSLVIYRRRQIKTTKKANCSNVVDPASIMRRRQLESGNSSTISNLVLEPMSSILLNTTHHQYQKPDNRSSVGYATQIDDGDEYYNNKPNAAQHNEN